jgi:predicted regulator of Ras-like GTPase activity (Roadblock/LC7/MglB family)
MSRGYAEVLDPLTRLRGVRGAMIVAGSDGVVVAESLMEGVKSKALAALASSLALRVSRVSGAAGRGDPRYFQLQAAEGALFVAPAPHAEDLLLVVIAGPETPPGMARLEVLKAAGQLT